MFPLVHSEVHNVHLVISFTTYTGDHFQYYICFVLISFYVSVFKNKNQNKLQHALQKG